MNVIVSPKRLVERHPDLLSITTLERWRSEGKGPPFVKVGPRRVGYRLADFERWLADRVVSSTADAKERLGKSDNGGKSISNNVAGIAA